MAFPAQLPSFTQAEYLAFERCSAEKHEYLDGVIYAMAGSSPEHSTITANVGEIITRQLRGSNCRPFSSDMKTRCIPLAASTASKSGLYAYPDFIVVCGEPVFHDQHKDVLTNPKLIVEVLSVSTENYDRTEKFRRYQQLESFTDYLLIAQDRWHVEHFSKQAEGRWIETVETKPTGNILIGSLNCHILLAELYEWVKLPAPSALE
jgi:Uma2 family endonuclease